jgi:hypothetical protein
MRERRNERTTGFILPRPYSKTWYYIIPLVLPSFEGQGGGARFIKSQVKNPTYRCQGPLSIALPQAQPAVSGPSPLGADLQPQGRLRPSAAPLALPRRQPLGAAVQGRAPNRVAGILQLLGGPTRCQGVLRRGRGRQSKGGVPMGNVSVQRWLMFQSASAQR